MSIQPRQEVLTEWQQSGRSLRLIGRRNGWNNEIHRVEIYTNGTWFPVEEVLDTNE